jgi:O-phosphoseryl-tRNA(Cys) synthetase
MTKKTKIEIISKSLDKVNQTEKKIEAFRDLLDSLADIDSKKKILWKEIYDNAVNDRNLANMLFTDSWNRMNEQNSTAHEIIGTTMSKYLERMCKSNEQILRLSELIQKAEEKSGKINADDLFSEIIGE